jgi:Tfp pilus assembly protein PilV
MVKLIKNKKKGFSIIEILIAISFIAVIVTGIFNISQFNSHVRKINDERTQALYYAVEGIEAAKLITWDQLTVGDHHFVKNANVWDISAGGELLDNKYTRTVVVSSVSRQSISQGNVYGAISTGANIDPDTKKITVIIDWLSKSGSTKQEKLETNISRFQANRWSQQDWVGGAGQAIWVDETKFDNKDAGIDVAVPGEATLLSGFFNWENGTTTAALKDSIPGNSTVNDIFEKDGKAYVVTNNSSGNSFFIFNVADINNPTLYTGGIFPAGASNAVVVSGDYAYLATSKSNKQVLVLDISDPNNITEAGYFNLGANAWDIGVSNSTAYAITDTRLYAMDISDLSQHTPYSGPATVQGAAKVMFLSKDYVYVGAYSSNNRELQVFYVANPITMAALGYYDLTGGSLTPTEIYVRGTRVYISTQNNSGGDEFFVFDATNPSGLLFSGSYSVNYTVYSFVIIGAYAILGINNSSNELRVIDISFPGGGGISLVKNFNLYGPKYGNQENNYVYALSANCSNIYMGTYNSSNSYELAIFSTRETDCGYADNGILESSTFDTGSNQVAYNWINWKGIEPEDTDIRFQLATSNNVPGPWNFVGPDGTSGTYFTNASGEFINYNYHLNQRYIRYKLFLSSQSGLQAPSVGKVTISYSTYP